MRKNYKVLLSLIIVLFICVGAVYASNHYELPIKLAQDLDKSWLVKFNIKLNPDTVNNDTVYVSYDEDGKNKVKDLDVYINPKDKRQVIVTPQTQWESGKIYYLQMTQNVESVSGKRLTNPVRMMFNTIKKGQYRVELSWGELPYDLDAELIINDKYIVDSLDREYNGYAEKDLDVATGYGTETIAIYKTNSFTDYEYIVRHYYGEGSLAESNAIVKLFNENGLVKEFEVPINFEGDEWSVFSIKNGKLITK